MTPAVIAINVLLSFIFNNGPHPPLPYDSIYPTCPRFLFRRLILIEKMKRLEEIHRIEGEIEKIKEAQRILKIYDPEGAE